jgi:hypothetical protein
MTEKRTFQQIIRKGFGAQVKFTRTYVNDNGQLTIDEVVKTSTAIIHPDLRNELNELEKYFRDYFDFSIETSLAIIGAKSIVLNGGVTKMAIIGEVNIANGSVIKVTAKDIMDNVNVWDWIGRMNKTMVKVAEEAFLYVDGKSAQLAIEYEDNPPMALEA